jgi:hypothetical protein
MLDDAESERHARVSRLVAGYREAARRALELARRYRDEESAAGGARERACIVQALAWRRAAHEVRAGLPVPMIPRPGLARAGAEAASEPSTKRAAG